MKKFEDAIACYAGRLKAPRENPRILRRQAAFWLAELDPTWSTREVRARVVSVPGLSAHAGQDLLVDYATSIRQQVKQVYINLNEQPIGWY